MSIIATDSPQLYLVGLILTFVLSTIAYWQLYNLAAQMAEFEFQPDLQLRDQFIQLHTVMIKGINRDISAETAAKGLKKVFSMRFDRESQRLLGV